MMAPSVKPVPSDIPKSMKAHVSEVFKRLNNRLNDCEKIYSNRADGQIDEATVYKYETHLEFHSEYGIFFSPSGWAKMCLDKARLRNGADPADVALLPASANGYIISYVFRNKRNIKLCDLAELPKSEPAAGGDGRPTEDISIIEIAKLKRSLAEAEERIAELEAHEAAASARVTELLAREDRRRAIKLELTENAIAITHLSAPGTPTVFVGILAQLEAKRDALLAENALLEI